MTRVAAASFDRVTPSAYFLHRLARLAAGVYRCRLPEHSRLDGAMSDENREESTAVEMGEDAGLPVNEVPDGVIDPTLFQLTMNVVARMDALVVEYLARDGYRYTPHRETRTVTTYDSGWPNVGLKKKDEASIAHRRLFAEERDSIHPFEYNDMAEIQALEEYVRQTPELLERASLPKDEDIFGEELHDVMLRHRIVDLPTSIYDRAMALSLNIEDPAVGELYIQRERSWLQPELPHQYVVPLLVTNIDIGEDDLRIDDRTRIERLSDEDLRRMAQGSDYAGVSTPLADAARYAVVIDMPPMSNPGEGRRMFAPWDPIDTPAIEAAVNALRIVSSVRTGWARVFRRPIGWADHWEDALPALTHMHTARRYPADLDDRGWLKPNRGISADEAAEVSSVAAAMKTADATAQLAIRRLSMALVRDAPDDQLIDACIGLEALLGQKGSELSYRIAVRAAALLATKADDPRDPKAVFRMARKVYERRSELVHGSTSVKNATFQWTPDGVKFSTSGVAVWLLRETLHERLLRPDWKVDDLDALVLRGLASAGSDRDPDEMTEGNTN